MSLPPLPEFLAQRDVLPAELVAPTSATLLRLYAWMQLARTADNRILDLFRQGLIKGTVAGGQGNEGLIVPLALLAQKQHDVVAFTHRDLGGHLIWSGHLLEHLNQYFANGASPTQAREGNVHHGDPANRSLPMISHLGSMASQVIGRTEAERRAGRTAVGFALFGDGGSSTGDIHESMNLAALLSAPVIFIVENNRYAYSTPVCEQFSADAELWRRAAGYGFEGVRLDATDPVGFAQKLAALIDDIRTRPRPLLIEAMTLRLRGHAAYDTCDYLRPGEQDAFLAADPLPRLRAELAARGLEASLTALDAELTGYVEACVQLGLAVPRPAPDAAKMLAEVYAPPLPAHPWRVEPAAPENLTLAQAINRGLRKILTERPEALLLGQDIADYGGAFKVTDGLLRDFGRSRVFNTPLAESACTGYAIGMGLGGHLPIEEFQFSDFVTEAITQITLNAATYHFRAGARVPLILRLPCGGGLTFGSFHSQELESMLLSMPGLKALYPSTPQDAFDALLAAADDGNPVLLFEHKHLYRRARGPVQFNPAYRDIWSPRLVRAGDFATLVTYGEMVHLAQEVAEVIAQEYGLELGVWDLRALAPLPLDAISAHLATTTRLVVLHEGRRTHGFGAELVARLTEQQFHRLSAPPLRLTSLDLPVPFAPELEQVHRPTRDTVLAALADWIG